MPAALRLTLLGTGTPEASLRRAGASYLLRLGEEQILVDCGPFAVHRLLEAGSRPTEITRLLLTHLHYDHAADYGHLVLNRWDEGAGNIPELDVYGPPPIERMTERLFGAEGVWGPDLAARTGNLGSQAVYEARGGQLPRLPPRPQVTTVEAGDVIERENWTIRVAEVVHFQPHLICLAYRADLGGTSIVFGGDTRPTPALTQLATSAEVLIHMCHYVTGEESDPRLTDTCSGHIEAAETARDAGVETLVLTHITPRVEQPGVRERVIHEAAEIFSGRIIFGEDLLDIPLKGGDAD